MLFRSLMLNRAILAGLAVFAFAMAISAERVKDLVETASAAGSAGVFVVAVFGLFTRFGGPVAAFAAITVGALSWLVFGALELETPYIAALGLALFTYLLAAVVENPAEALSQAGARACKDGD